tara:strand:+ start:64970 stop:66763 length:1794 start_codon:yes stop_codon:yes gene_type:complete
MKYSIVFILLFLSFCTVAQISPDCSTAIPICNNTPVNSGTNNYGIDDFNGANKSGCLEKTLSGAIESNSAWYRFKTNASGQLGFNISVNASEDWDFALYKTTDCSNLGDPVRCNFLDNNGESSFLGVGIDPTGNTSNINYEDWLMVEPGEDYYLLINNFSNINSGFSIQFSGSIFSTNPYDALDCSIISNLLGPPIAACESDFIELDATTSDATAYEWYKDTGSGFQQIIGATSATLTILDSADYRVVVTRASENIISDVQISFTSNPTAETVENKILCYDEDDFDLSTVDAEVIGNQSPNDVIVSYYSTFSDAVNGMNSLDKNHPKYSGLETIYIRVGSFKNPKCFDVSQSFDLIVTQEIIQDFPITVFLCEENGTILIGDDTPNTNYSYQWDTGETTAAINVSMAGRYGLTISTAIQDLICSEEFYVDVFASKSPKISTISIEDLKDNNTITIETDFDGNYEYQLDDGAYQSSPFFENVLQGKHTVSVNDIDGCGVATETLLIMGFSKFFTPNGDGVNDDWLIEGLNNLNSPIVYIYDRYGKLIQQLDPLKTTWDGRYNGLQMPASDYWFQLTYIEDNGDRIIAKYINNHFTLKR